MNQIVQILGAILILAPFALAQFRVLGPHSWPYLLPNAGGSAILCVIASCSSSGASCCWKGSGLLFPCGASSPSSAGSPAPCPATDSASCAC